MRRPARILLTILPLISCGVLAQDDDPADLFTVPLSELVNVTVVSATLHEQDLMESPSAVAIVTRDDIRYSAARTIPELLQYVVGLDGYTKTHTDMDLAARGLAGDETPKMLLLLDGQPVNVVPYGGVQWPTLPVLLDDIDRIEVVRGPASAIYGADALAGVINILTRNAEDRATMVSLAYGEHGAQQYDAHWQTGLGQGWQLALSGGFVRTENTGVKDTDRRPGTPANWDRKDHADIGLASYRLDHEGTTSRFTSMGGFSATGDEGYNPSPGDLVVDKARKRTLYLNNKYVRDIGENHLELRVGLRNLWQENQKLEDGSYAFKYKVRRGLGVDGDLHYLVHSLAGHTLILGANTSYLQASRDIANEPPYLYDEDETLVAGYLQDQIRLLQDRLLVTLSARYDKWSTLDGQFSPRLAGNLALAEGRLNLRASWGTSFRRPSFDENHYFVSWPTGWFKGAAVDAVTEDGRFIAGELLGPEKLAATELGLRWQPESWLALDLTAFQHDLDDLLGYTVYHASGDELNLGNGKTGEELMIRGLETELRTRFGQAVEGFLNHTYQDATITGPDGLESRWDNAPRHKVSGGVRWYGPVVVDLRARWVDAVTYSEIPDAPVADYGTVDLAVSKVLARRFFLKLAVQNLLDDAHHEYPLYTQLVRRARLAVQYHF